MTERFMVDDCGTLIDMTNRNTYDYVSDVCELLNELHEENQRLRNKNRRLHKEWDKLWELCREHMTDEEIIKELSR